MIRKNISDYEVVITKNDKINEHYYLLGISKPTKFEAEAGQFVNIKIEPYSLEPFLRRPFSIFYMDEFEIGVLYQIKGEGTNLLSTKKVGTRLKMIGPLGTSFPIDNDKIGKYDGVFLIAGGIGIAPLFYYAKKIREKYESIDLNLGFGIKDESFLLPDDFLKYNFSTIFLAVENRISLSQNIYSNYDGKIYQDNAINILYKDEFKSFTKKYRNPLFGVCGPDAMLKAFITWNSQYSYESYLSLESFMGCGFNACLGCAVPKKNGGYLYLCNDGPVVDYKEISL